MKRKESKLRRVLTLTLVFLMIMITIGRPSPALATGEGVISGQVVNKTANGSAVGTVEVTLTQYLNGTATSDGQKVTTDAAGKFEFRGLSADNGTAYTVSTSFQDADYISEDIVLTSASPLQSVELDVYDSTTSDENIQVSNGHMVVYVIQGDLHVEEIWRFSNIGDRTFIGMQGKAAGTTLRFTLPAGATYLSPGQASSIETTGTGVASNVAVPPGITDVTFSYFIPYQGSSMTILRKTNYPIANFSLLVEDAGVKVTSTALTSGTPQMMNGTNFLYFTANNVAANTELDAALSGIINPSAASSETFSLWPWMLGGVGMLGLVLTVAYSQLKKKQTTTVSPAPSDRSSGQSDEDALLMELAQLDDAYEAGTTGENEYRAQRARAKARLIEAYGGTRV